jgi:hypothetical protein
MSVVNWEGQEGGHLVLQRKTCGWELEMFEGGRELYLADR